MPPSARSDVTVIASAYLKSRGEAEEQPASNTNDEREAEDARVHGEVNSLRKHEGVEQGRVDQTTKSAAIEPQTPSSTDSVSH